MPLPKLIGPWRHLFQWTMALLWFGIPLVRVGGRSLVEFDLPAQTLHLAGHSFRIEELLLLWLVVMAAIFTFLLVTMIFGRVWCGWGCPQTAFVDLAEAAAHRLGMKTKGFRLDGTPGARMLLYLIFLAGALLAGASFVWYFVPPVDYFPLLFTGRLGAWPLGTTLAVAGVVLGDLVFLRRLFCRDFCPYGRFQTVIVHPGTMTLRELPSEKARCIDCHACLRCCPMGIDIRNGYQIECINCARCLDACRKIMASRKESGIIGYTFGYGDQGWRTLIDLRLTGITVVLIGLLAGLMVVSGHLTPVSLKLQRAAGVKAAPRDDGRIATVFTGYLRNRTDRPLRLKIAATLENGDVLTINGPSDVALSGSENRRLQLGVVTQPPSGAPLAVVFTVRDEGGRKMLASRAFIPQSGQ